MGYSGRYHAASLVAVFVALAIGILIGIGLADDVVSGASKELVDSLRGDLSDAQTQVDDLQTELDQTRQFSDAAAPALVAGKLNRRRVALIELGPVSKDTAEASKQAIEAAGGKLASVAVVALPPDPQKLADAAGPRFSLDPSAPGQLGGLGAAVGRQLVGGGALVDRLKGQLFSKFSGSLDGVSMLVVARQLPGDVDASTRVQERNLASGLLGAADDAAAGMVGVERTDTDPTTLAPIANRGIPTVDDIDLAAGKVATVYALRGAAGSFGVKQGTIGLLPDLVSTGQKP